MFLSKYWHFLNVLQHLSVLSIWNFKCLTFIKCTREWQAPYIIKWRSLFCCTLDVHEVYKRMTSTIQYEMTQFILLYTWCTRSVQRNDEHHTVLNGAVYSVVHIMNVKALKSVLIEISTKTWRYPLKKWLKQFLKLVTLYKNVLDVNR